MYKHHSKDLYDKGLTIEQLSINSQEKLNELIQQIGAEENIHSIDTVGENTGFKRADNLLKEIFLQQLSEKLITAILVWMLRENFVYAQH